MGLKQLSKLTTGIPVVDRVLSAHVDALNSVLRDTPQATKGQIVQGQWNAPTLINGWSSGQPVFQHLSPGYMMDAQGFVHLRGLLVNVAGQPANQAAFVLPVGFRPQRTATYANVGDAGYSRLNVGADGTVLPSVNIIVAANGFRSLDGITFDTRA